MNLNNKKLNTLNYLKNFTLLMLAICLFAFPALSQESNLEIGKKLYQQQKFPEAINVFKKLINTKEYEKVPEAWYYLGLSYFSNKKIEDSVWAFQKATKLDKRNAKIWNSLGMAYLQTSDNKKARKSFQKAVKTDSTVASYRANLAYAYVMRGKYKKAHSESKKAIKLDPKNSNAYYFKGVSNLWQRKFDEAVLDAEKVIELNPTFSSSYLLKADALLYKYGKEWKDGEKSSGKLSTLKNAISTLDDCLNKCAVSYKTLIKTKKNGIQAFYRYFNRKNGNSRLTSNDPRYKNIQILSKPKPGYTDIARQSNTSGEVRIAVLFGASGNIEGLLVLEGLPNGLTQMALKAAKKIKFKPPTIDGKPFSVVKTVVFNFQIY